MIYKIIIKERNSLNQIVLYEGENKIFAYQIVDVFISATAKTPHVLIRVEARGKEA